MSSQDLDAGRRLKVFVSYSRADIDFADQLVLALEDKGFDPILDRHDIDGAEKWKDRLGALIFSCDTVVFVLTDTSAASKICHWEVEEAARLGKRMIPIVPRSADGVPPPPALGELNYIHFYTTPAIPGSGFYDGVQKLVRALSVDLDWLRERTRLSEDAVRWQARMRDSYGSGEVAVSSMLLHGNVLQEAQAWARAAPSGADVPAVVSEFLAASAAAEAQRNAEAQVQLAQREAALRDKEEAVAARAKADTLARRATLIGIGIAIVLIGLSGWMGLAAAAASHKAAENRAAVFAGEADTRFAQGRHAEAMLIALGGDPAARRGGLIERIFYAPAGYGAARAALVGATVHNRLVRTVSAPEGEIRAFSADGRRLLLVSQSGVALVESESGRVLQNFENDQADPFFVGFSPDGARVVTVYWDQGAWLWDAESGQRLATFGASTGSAASALPPGRRIVLGDEIEAAERLGTFGEGGGSVAAAVSPDGRRIVVGNSDGRFRIFDTQSGQQVRVVDGHERSVNALAFSPDGRQLLTGAADNLVRLWDVESGRLVQTFSGHTGRIRSVAFAPNGRGVLTGSLDTTVRLWDINSARGLLGFEGHRGPVRAVAFSPDGRRILTGGEDDVAILWDAETGVAVRRFEGLEDGVRAVAFASDGQSALTGSESGVVRFWRADDEGSLAALGAHQLAAAAMLSRDGVLRLALASSSDTTIRVVDAANGHDVHALSAVRGIGSLAISADGRFVAAGSLPVLGDSNQSVIQLWDADTGAVQRQFDVRGNISAVAVSSDGGLVLAGANPPLGQPGAGAAQMWDAATGASLRRFEGHEGTISSLAISRDAHRVLTGSADRTARIWDADTGQVLHSLEGHQRAVTAVALSNDGRRALTGAADGSVRLWDVESERVLQTFRGHAEAITSVAFSPDGLLVLTGSFDHTARLWEAESGRTLQTYTGHVAELRSVAFLADGQRVVTASRDLAAIRAIDPIVFASAREQVRLACGVLAQIGMTRFADADRERFPILRDEPDSPCPTQRQ